MKTKRLASLAVVVLIGVVVASVQSNRPFNSVAPTASAASEEKTSAQAEEKAVSVVVDDAAGVMYLKPRQYAGQFVPIEEVEIVPRVTGWIEKINFKEGDEVKEGDLLFEIEDTTYRAALATAEGALEQATAEQKNAQISFDRASDLFQRQAGSQADVDDAESRLAIAQATVKQAQAAQIDAENTLSYTKIKSPISGRIGKVTVTRGNLVTPTTGKLVDIKSYAPIYVRFAIGESVFNDTFGGESKIRDLAGIKICPVGKSRDDYEAMADYPDATITLIDNKVDPSTNTVVIWATVENSDNRFIPGSYATVILAKKRDEPVVAILLSAVGTTSDGNFVYVVDKNNRVEKRFVKLGMVAGRYQVIDEGLAVGEKVIVEGTNKVEDGSLVKPISFDPTGKYEEIAPKKAAEEAPKQAESKKAE